MKARSAPTAAFVVALMAAGCANDGTLTTGGLNTSSIDQAQKDPACLTLAAQIEALNRDGTGDKVSKAAAKKYKLKSEDLAKADELNKANTEFQTKCSAYPPRPVVATTTTPAPATTTTTAAKDTKDAPKEKKVAVKKTTTPPVPTAKPPAATAAATTTPPGATTTTTTAMPPQTAENPDPTLPTP